MKITTFNPMILSKNAEAVISLFEELGFEKSHVKTGLGSAEVNNITHVRMKNPDGFHVDVSKLDLIPQDVTTIRMNVDDFDEAYELLKSHGFKNVQGDNVSESPTGKGTTMVSPSGFSITISHHKK